MIFDKVNITQELKKKHSVSFDLKNEVAQLLSQSAKNDEQVLIRLKNNNGDSSSFIELNESDAENIFTLNEIETICLTYRLRFLDSKYFKQEFPYDAVVRINEFEKRHNTKIKRFKIIAPGKAFDLQEVNQDPLLFAQINNNLFYLIHQWGNDLAWYRKFLYYPVRNIYTYFYSILTIAAIFAFTIPFEWFQVKPDNIIYMRVWFTLHCFIGLFFIIIFIGGITQASFTSMNWKSKYMNE